MPVFWRGPSKGCPHTIRVCIGRAMSFVPRQLCVTPVQACAGHASLSVVARRFAAGEGVRRTKAESGLAGTLLPGQGTITHIMQAGKGGGGRAHVGFQRETPTAVRPSIVSGVARFLLLSSAPTGAPQVCARLAARVPTQGTVAASVPCRCLLGTTLVCLLHLLCSVGCAAGVA